MKQLLITPLLFLSLAVMANDYDLQKPFGFCTRSSRTSNADSYAYNITGGGCYVYPVTNVSSDKMIILTSTGQDMKNQIANAIKKYDVIIFDGSQGDFIVSSSIGISSYKNKTLMGINNARLCTSWHVTQAITDALDAAARSCESAVDMVAARIPARITPAIRAGIIPCVARRFAI